MKRYCTVLLLFSLPLLFLSCQKEVEDIFATPGLTPPASDSNYISRFIELDTTYVPGMDTFYKRTWSYDANKRVNEVLEIQFAAGTHDSDYTLHEYRFYTGTDSVPFKIVRKEWFAGPENFTDTIFLSYNSNKLITKDSAIHYKDGSLIAYIVNRFNQLPDGSWRIMKITDGGVGLLAIDSILSRRTVSAGNILAASDSVYNSVPPSLYSSSFYQFTYDNKNNPFLRTLLPYPVRNFDPSVIFQPFYYPVQSTLNNPLTYTQTHNIGGGTSVITGACGYVYNNRGYPAIIRYSSSALSNPVKGLVFYSVL
jgi:hypothetical protein